MSRVHKADFPAEQSEAQASPWLPLADGHQERPEGPRPASGEGPQAPERLIERSSPEGRDRLADTSPTVTDRSARLVRLRVRREFLFVAEGLSERRRSLVVQARRRAEARDDIGAGFTATRKVGNSVIRNRARRRLREAAAASLPRLGDPGTDYVFIARQDTGERPWSSLLDEMESALISLRRRLAAGVDIGQQKRSGRSSTKKG